MAEARTLRGALSVLITATLVLGGMASGIPAASAEELPQGPAVVASGDEAAPTGDQAGSASAGVGSTETKPQPGAPNEGALPPAPATKPAGEASPPSAPQKPSAEQPSEPKAPAIATSAPASLENIRNSGGNLNWGFKASWRTYLSDWASGTQTPFGGATLNADGTTRFPESTASTFDPVAGTGTIAYTGGVLWTSTAHGFSIALQNPRVDVHSDGSATVSAETSTADTAGASSVARIIVATIPAVGTSATADGKITWTGANGTFAPSLAPGGISRYSGQAADPFTFSTPAAPAQVWAPKLAVSTVDGKALASGATVYEGDEIVVRGSGFDPEAHPLPQGSRPPVTVGDPTGNYVVFGNFATEWKPSSGAPSDSRSVASQKWAMTDKTFGNLDPRYASSVAKDRIVLGADGSFEARLTVTAAKATPGSYGVFAFAAGGPKDASQEIELRLNYQAERPQVWAPKLAVSTVDGKALASGATVYEGDEIVVRGTGFDPEAHPLPQGSRPPVTVGDPTGNYVVFGNFATEWKPSSGAPSDSRSVASQKWAMTDKTFGNLDPRYASSVAKDRIVLGADGSFEARLTVTAAKATPGSYGVFAFAAGGPKDASQEIELRLNYQAERGSPSVTVDKLNASTAGIEATISGQGLTREAAPNGVYVAIVEAGAAIMNGREPEVQAVAWITADKITDGAFTTQLLAPAAKLDREKKYEALVWKAHGPATAQSTVLRKELQLTPANWDAVFGPSTSRVYIDPKVTKASASGVEIGADIARIKLGSADAGIYYALIEKGTEDKISPQNMGLDANLVNKGDIVDGAVSVKLSGAATKLDRKKNYEVLVWRAHNMPTAQTILGRADVQISEAQWDQVFGPEVTPEGKALVNAATPAGLSINAELSGFRPEKYGAGVQLGVIEAGTAATVAESAVLGRTAVESFPDTGSLKKSFSIPAAQLDRAKKYQVLVWKAGAKPGSAANILVLPLAISASHWDSVFPAVVETTEGSFSWGVRKAFRNYVTGPIARGKITVQKPATGTDVYTFPQTTGGTWNAKTHTGTVQFAGLVNFKGHLGPDGYALNLDLANPVLEITSAQSALLKAPENQTKRLITIATLDLTKAKKTALNGGAVRFENAPVKLTRAGADEYFDEYLTVDSAMDPASFTVGAAANVKPVTPPIRPVVTPPAPKPKPKPVPVRSTGGQQAGSLTWGISSGFASYTTGRIAKGSISSSGVGGGPGGYIYPQSSSTWNAKTQTGTVQYSGVVTFSGHKGLMSESFANPVIRITSSTSGSLTAGGRTFGLNLAAGSKSTGPKGEVTWSGVPLSGGISGGGSGGGGAFGADPVTFTVGAANGAAFGSSSVGAEDTKRTPAKTPPATTGIRVITSAEKIVAGGEIEFEASRFEANERDVLVVLYSEPIVLDEAAGADANGVVRWIGTLPKDLPKGSHTITLQGSTNAGAIIEVVDAKKAKDTRAIEAATVDPLTPAEAAIREAEAQVPIWLYWAGAIGLLAIAATMSGLVIAQRRRAE